MIELKNNIIRFFILFWMIGMITYSCVKDKPESLNLPDYSINEYTYQLLKGEKWYLWVDSMNLVAPDSTISPEQYLDTLLYKKRDKWSFMMDATTYDQEFSQGIYTGYGFLALLDNNGYVRVAMVFTNSPFGEAGIKRGNKLISINGNDAATLYNSDQWSSLLSGSNQHTFIIEDNNGNQHSYLLTKAEIKQNTVTHYEVLTVNNIKTGYLVFHTFIQPSVDELNAVFSYFNQQNVTQLILDLRYNTGGQLDVAQQLLNLIAGIKENGKLCSTMEYNAYKSDLNSSEYFSNIKNAISIQKVIAITTSMTASASELVINDLKPYLEVKTVGTKSDGKPVGMRVFRYKDWVEAPITFKNVNANNEGDYYNGLPVDSEIADGLDKDWGDPEEACFKEAVYYLQTGEFHTISLLKSTSIQKAPNPLKGFQWVIGAY